MSVDLVSEVWAELKSYIHSSDRTEAAETLVSLLIDNNYDADEIKTLFRGDSEIKRALQTYLEDDIEEEDDDDDSFDGIDEDY